MPPPCSSARRCSSTSCPACAWRYSLTVARRILARDPRCLHLVTIAGAASTPREFRRWRKAIHNSVAYRRRRSRWWRSVGLWGWHDGLVLHGLVALGSISATEFTSALRRHGDVRLRPVDIANVRAEVYAAALSVSNVPARSWIARYQPIKIAIEPVTIPTFSTPKVSGRICQPMPILF